MFPQFEGSWWREEVGYFSVKVSLLGTGGTVGQLEIVEQPRGGGRFKDRTVEKSLRNGPPHPTEENPLLDLQLLTGLSDMLSSSPECLGEGEV